MKSLLRLIAFGAASGFVWGFVPLTLSELWQSTGLAVSTLFAGSVTGIAVTFVLAGPLQYPQRWIAGVLGAASLPLGAFLFGVVATWIQFGLSQWLGVTYRFVRHGFEPLQIGRIYALCSLIPWFAIVLVPAAVGTTLMLQGIIHHSDHDTKILDASAQPRS